jgi:hypothetical protein
MIIQATNLGEIPMANLHPTANFTVFGGVYPAERHSSSPLRQPRSGSVGPLAAVLVALVIGTATTSGAIAAIKRIQTTGYGFQTAGYFAVNGMPALREVVW